MREKVEQAPYWMAWSRLRGAAGLADSQIRRNAPKLVSPNQLQVNLDPCRRPGWSFPHFMQRLPGARRGGPLWGHVVRFLCPAARAAPPPIAKTSPRVASGGGRRLHRQARLARLARLGTMASHRRGIRSPPPGMSPHSRARKRGSQPNWPSGLDGSAKLT